MCNIAVLIPTYKPESYIESCLSSIENQSLSKEKFKVYIALNGPRQDYETYILDLIKRFTFSVDYIYIEASGVSNARNRLLDISSEPYITFIDDDDMISNNFLEALLSVATTDYMAISDTRSFKRNIESTTSNFVGKSYPLIRNLETSKFKTRKYYSTPWAKLLHRDMIGDIRFNTKLSIGEDSLFMAEISSAINGIVKPNETTYYYVNEREGSVTRSEVNRSLELNRIVYLIYIYSNMLFRPNKDKVFVISRIIASFKHLKRII